MGPDFFEACNAFPYRFTMEHVPKWAKVMMKNRRFPAPHFVTDREWYHSSEFRMNRGRGGWQCRTRSQRWPLGKYLRQPYTKSIRLVELLADENYPPRRFEMKDL